DKITPDYCGVQEEYPEQVESIREACARYVSFGVGREDGVSEGEHMSIFFNSESIEMLDGGTYWLSDTPDVPSTGWDAACRRTATWALFKIKATGSEFYYVNTHLDHVGTEARRNGLALIVDRIADMNTDGHPMVLTGDFNVFPDDTCLTDLNTKMLSARATADTTDDKVSYNSFGLGGSGIIDYIYYSGFDCCKSFRVVDETFLDIPYISDHYPVTAILKF
ncbi:MAG: endonuclease/exonuclease/phosphatase family protein, partial [Bacteroidales bacterium]|nr:endonuclease/exonuclease/phosphatase family protein [Bacteroidales bacterium]